MAFGQSPPAFITQLGSPQKSFPIGRCRSGCPRLVPRARSPHVSSTGVPSLGAVSTGCHPLGGSVGGVSVATDTLSRGRGGAGGEHPPVVAPGPHQPADIIASVGSNGTATHPSGRDGREGENPLVGGDCAKPLAKSPSRHSFAAFSLAVFVSSISRAICSRRAGCQSLVGSFQGGFSLSLRWKQRTSVSSGSPSSSRVRTILVAQTLGSRRAR